jgi:hypothetical protein
MILLGAYKSMSYIDDYHTYSAQVKPVSICRLCLGCYEVGRVQSTIADKGESLVNEKE